MNLKIALLILVILVQIVSCKKDPDPSLSLDKNEVTVKHNSTSQLTPIPDQACKWSSMDTNIATVSQSGLVTGHKIGGTIIIAKTAGDKISAQCIVHVTASSFMYKEPVCVFGQSTSYVKGMEFRPLLAEEPTGLLYEGENANVWYVIYGFTGSALTSADVILKNTTENFIEAETFLQERYFFAEYYNNVAFYWDRNSIAAALYIDADLGLNVLYYRPGGKKSNHVDFDEYLQVLKQFQSKR